MDLILFEPVCKKCLKTKHSDLCLSNLSWVPLYGSDFYFLVLADLLKLSKNKQ